MAGKLRFGQIARQNSAHRVERNGFDPVAASFCRRGHEERIVDGRFGGLGR